jgi:hypothetical protein
MVGLLKIIVAHVVLLPRHAKIMQKSMGLCLPENSPGCSQSEAAGTCKQSAFITGRRNELRATWLSPVGALA